jgi:O-methyltransferase
MFEINKYPLVSNQVNYFEIKVILRELENVLNGQVPGAIAEFGCYTGTTSLFITRLLREMRENRAFHVYDSFDGLPQKTAADASPAGEQFTAGELKATKAQFIKHFKHAGLPLPTIHKAWFQNLTSNDVPPLIAFAFLDGDFFNSIYDSLKLIEHRTAPGATIIVDDYQAEALPGARKAVDAWLKDKTYKIRTEQSLAIIHT